MGLQVGPTKTETEPNQTNLCEAKEFSIKFSFRLSIIGVNFSPGCGQRVSVQVLGVPSSISTSADVVDSCRWLPMKINLVEFKWNSARCAKTKTECFEEPTLVPTHTHTLVR